MPELCDTTFLVGEERQPICGVKAILAARSRYGEMGEGEKGRGERGFEWQEVEGGWCTGERSQSGMRKPKMLIREGLLYTFCSLHLHLIVVKVEHEEFSRIMQFDSKLEFSEERGEREGSNLEDVRGRIENEHK